MAPRNLDSGGRLSDVSKDASRQAVLLYLSQVLLDNLLLGVDHSHRCPLFLLLKGVANYGAAVARYPR